MRGKSSIYSRYFTYIKPVIKIPIVRTYGSTIFTLLVMAIFIIFAIKPTIETILVLQKKLSDSKQILTRLIQKSNNLDLGRQNYSNLDEPIKYKISQIIPNTTQLRTVTQTLEQLAKTHEASVAALQIQPLVLGGKTESSPTSISEISYTFNITGEYKNIISLLQDLRKADRLISVDNLSLSHVSEGTGLIMSISGKAYYLK